MIIKLECDYKIFKNNKMGQNYWGNQNLKN